MVVVVHGQTYTGTTKIQRKLVCEIRATHNGLCPGECMAIIQLSVHELYIGPILY